MKAIILAAGIGKRLKPLTDSIPKCLIRIHNETLIERYIRFLKDCKVEDIVIVTGHLKDSIVSAVKGKDKSIRFIYNPDYRKGNVTSLYAAKDELASGCIVMDADVYFEKKVLENLIRSPHENCFLMDSSSSNTGEEMVIAAKGKKVMAIDREISGSFDVTGEGVGFVKISNSSARRLTEILKRFIDEGKLVSEYEECLNELVKTDYFGYEKVDDLKWTEIDFKEDIEAAERIAKEF